MRRTTLFAALRVEFSMQVRKPSLWATVAAIMLVLYAGGGFSFGRDTSLGTEIANSAVSMNLLLLVAVGALVADRLVRDRRLGLTDLLNSTPGPLPARLCGKYLGTSAAAAVPLLAVWALQVTHIAIHYGSASAIALGAAAFLSVTVPGLLFVCAFSIACPTFLGLPIYRVLFVGYWFWGNLLPRHVLPTLSGTWLTPVGKYAAAGLFSPNGHALLTGASGSTVAAAIASICLLLGLAAMAAAALPTLERRRWEMT